MAHTGETTAKPLSAREAGLDSKAKSLGHFLASPGVIQSDWYQPEKSAPFLAMPVLISPQEALAGQRLSYNAQARDCLFPALGIKAKDFMADIIAELLNKHIERAIMTQSQLRQTLRRINRNKDIIPIMEALHNTWLDHEIENITDNAADIMGYLIQQQLPQMTDDIGTLTAITEKAGLSYVFELDDIVVYWEMPLTAFPQALQILIASFACSLGDLCHAGIPDIGIHGDYDLFYYFESLNESQQHQVITLWQDCDNASDWLNKLDVILGQETAAELYQHLDDYYDHHRDDVSHHEEIVDCLTLHVDSLSYERLPYIKQAKCYQPDKLHYLVSRLRNRETEFTPYPKLYQGMFALAEAVMRFYQPSDYEFDYEGEEISLYCQQFLLFDDSNLCDIGVQRIEAQANYLMETGESSQMVIKPYDVDCMRAFKNIQLGWLTLSSLRTLVNEALLCSVK